MAPRKFIERGYSIHKTARTGQREEEAEKQSERVGKKGGEGKKKRDYS